MLGAQLRWRVVGLEADAKPGARGLGEAFEGPGRGFDAPAFEARDDGLRGTHGPGDLRLRHPCPAARCDQGRGEGKLALHGFTRSETPDPSATPLQPFAQGCYCCSCHLLRSSQGQLDLAPGRLVSLFHEHSDDHDPLSVAVGPPLRAAFAGLTGEGVR